MNPKCRQEAFFFKLFHQALTKTSLVLGLGTVVSSIS